MDYSRALATLQQLKHKITASVKGSVAPQGPGSARQSINNELLAINVAIFAVGQAVDACSAPVPVQSAVWAGFSKAVDDHVAGYAVPQYGDVGDEVSTWSPEEIATQIRKYSARVGRNVRPGQELLDCLKMAHLASRLHARLSGNDPTVTGGSDDV